LQWKDKFVYLPLSCMCILCFLLPIAMLGWYAIERMPLSDVAHWLHWFVSRTERNPFTPFEIGMSVLCLSHHCILEAWNLFWFHRLIPTGEFSKVNALGLTHIWFWSKRWTLEFELMVEWVETLGVVGIVWMACEKDMNFGGHITTEKLFAMVWMCPPKFMCWKQSQYNNVERWDL
jgi:hypothetical protein